MLKRAQKVDAVLVVLKNCLLFIAAGGDMIDGTGILYAQRAGHGATVA